ncbi:hypothetical protein [Lysinibacillus fusiformis]|uniref:Uncharacterized protein n=1 Tax=Lysinibacillus fusiformis TaxID=28031 RepID=A0A1E4R9W6_9BACI|nr:hypothetical protein [Lysinibacillus fusiformis]ODV57260.1 hypothetical protein BG258_15760 [Lysinibacillus fusiformis]
MKKLFYIGALSALLLIACGEEEAALKEEAPVSEEKDTTDKVAETKGPSQEELNEKMRSEAVELDFVKANGGEIEQDTKVTISGKVTNITEEGVGGTFTVTTKEGDGYGMFSVKNFALKDVTVDSEVTVYGVFDGKDELGFPTINATIIE